MEHGACNVIYTNRRAHDEHIRRGSLSSSLVAHTTAGTLPQGYFSLGKTSPREIHDNVELLLSTFNQVHICGSGQSCLNKISELLESAAADNPTIVLIDIPYDEEQRLKRLSREPRTPSPTATRTRRSDTAELEDLYGFHLLTHVSSEIQSQNFSRLVIPIAILSGFDRGSMTPTTFPASAQQTPQLLTDPLRLARYLDAGAVDVLSSPLSADNVQGLAVHAYRIHKEVSRAEAAFLTTKRKRKLSWVGVNDTKPYAYLREAMVSSLMSGICNPETVGESLDPRDLYVDEDRRPVIAAAIGSWAFSAHDFTDDELLYGALLMVKHALEMPEVEEWRMTDDELIIFLLASRTAYNEFVLYHNFRHVSDVLQAVFFFLVQIGALPPYPSGSPPVDPSHRSPIAHILGPFDALTLLISAIGHDVGHPGVNNAFLVALNAPLAQLYNDRSVLESFHCAAYAQILRRYWPKAFADAKMRKLMINSILATDMGLHFKYMSDLGNLQEKVGHDKDIVEEWNAKVREEHKDLTCGLLIKCADISNVARKFDVAVKWAHILTDEFSNQGVMEQELEIPSCLFGGPPVRDDLIKLGESQIGFINIFAKPLFEGVADILPGMQFAVDEMATNEATWVEKIAEAKRRKEKDPHIHLGLLSHRISVDPDPSPFSDPALRSAPDRTEQPTSYPESTAPDDKGRKGSRGSVEEAPAIRRASLGFDKSASMPGVRSPASLENLRQSRRGSGDASITAFIVTESPDASEDAATDVRQSSAARSRSPAKRKDTLTRQSPQRGYRTGSDEVGHGARPVTAPSRRSPGKSPSPHKSCSYDVLRPGGGGGPDLDSNHPLPHPRAQGGSDVDRRHAANGSARNRSSQWHSKDGPDSSVTMSDTSRESSRRSEWWRLGSRRRNRDCRNGTNGGHSKEMMLDPAMMNAESDSTSPTSTSPGRSSTTGKLKTFFKWKPRSSEEHHEKQLSSFGSSSHLRTPPTSDPGVSVNSSE
ncbi:HD-domain/PDEase-like protein [Westerdykella ornata]|uniref:Phosphodiesterase n=1 Tax=Westerdykella ornata TaxID=318751 RepID=A0A6A6JIV8_WESOR|nr:HD-domain/PDEase-like protein [Westerdykella ornata]KAF2275888.1 HD-domain/PDEase-like protein [Westerdykella ornata]